MSALLDATIHMCAADLARVTLNGRTGIDNGQLVAVLGHRDLVTRRHGHYREQRTLGLPALRAAAGMVVRRLGLDGNLDRVLGAFTHQRAASKVLGRRL